MKKEIKLKGFAAIAFITGVMTLAYWLCKWTDNTLEFWLSYFKHHYVDVPNWISVVVTCVFNAVIVAANIISEIIKIFVTQ